MRRDVILFLVYGAVLLYVVFNPVHLTVQHYVNFKASGLARFGAEAEGNGETNLTNLVFGIGSSAATWEKRKELVRIWWKPDGMRGCVWLDKQVSSLPEDNSTMPKLQISADTSRFRYTYRGSSSEDARHHIRITRIVSEMFRLGLDDVHWFVMGDDDTVFVPDNLVKVLSKYDHRKPYYIGSISESHYQNVHGFSSNMGYGGAGFAVSVALAEELDKVLDKCLETYHYLYSADARIHACVSELGIPLTVERGFHQFDVLQDVSGLLSSHPLTPLVSLHHIEVLEPFFPDMKTVNSVRHLVTSGVGVDPMGLLQQSFCYDRDHNWTIKVASGYVVQVYKGHIPEKDLEVPMRTFDGWHGDHDRVGIAFKTRDYPSDLCDLPVNFYLTTSTALGAGQSSSIYAREGPMPSICPNTDRNLSLVSSIEVMKDVAPDSWLLEAPRRQRCTIHKHGAIMQLRVENSL